MQKEAQTKKKRVVFSLDAPEAKEVLLVGAFNMWDKKRHPMKKAYNGTWKKIVIIPRGRHEYKFLVDGEWWNDPKNEEFCPNEHGTLNSVITVS